MRAGLIALCLVAGGCDLDGGAYQWPDAYVPDEGDGGGSLLSTRGRFEVVEGVDLVASGAVPFVRLDGVITTGDTRPMYRRSLIAGTCELLTLDNPPQCSGVCAGLCIADDQCVDKPRHLSAGDIRIDGLLATVDFIRLPDNSYVGEGPLPDDLFTSEAVVHLNADGDEVTFFAMSAGGVRALNTDLPLTPVVLGSSDFTITWPSPDPTTEVVLELFASNQFHGQPLPAIIRCVEFDDGELTVAGSLLAAFPEALPTCAGVDCPFARLRRQHNDSVLRSGVPLEMMVAHEVRFAIDHQP